MLRIILMFILFFSCEWHAASAATLINLRHTPLPSLFSITPQTLRIQATPTITLENISQHTDATGITHTRYQQTFQGIPVRGGHAITHQTTHPFNASVKTIQPSPSNGIVFQGLQQDLLKTPASVYTPSTINRIVHQTMSSYQQNTGQIVISTPMTKKLITIDHQKAHWALQIHFNSQDKQSIPHQPVFIINMETGAVEQTWDNLKTQDFSAATATGFGGNKSTGRYRYGNDHPLLNIQRDPQTNICYLKNSNVVVQDMRQNGLEYQFHCEDPKKLSAISYETDKDIVNGAYSPSNDALYDGYVIQTLYRKWYGIPALTQRNGQPMSLIMRVHYGHSYENAYWDGNTMTFGDGGNQLYPLVTLDVAAHEISHGFTEQHADLEYHDQSGALNESFSDMAAQAAEYFSEGNNHWMIGDKLLKNGGALRYMDVPEKDTRSISNINEYDALIERIHQETPDEYARQSMIVHFASGVYNRFFYALATAPTFDPHTAFDIVVKANQDYWTPTTDFKEAACALLDAQANLNGLSGRYPRQPLEIALKNIGFTDLSVCTGK